MNAATAEAWLRLRLQPGVEPALTDPEIVALLDVAATTDTAGITPDGDDWEPTYSRPGIYRAIAEGWKIKAAKVAGAFDFTTDGQQFRRSQIVDHCESQVALWSKKAGRSLTITSDT